MPFRPINATGVSLTPTELLEATNVQAAFDELNLKLRTFLATGEDVACPDGVRTLVVDLADVNNNLGTGAFLTWGITATTTGPATIEIDLTGGVAPEPPMLVNYRRATVGNSLVATFSTLVGVFGDRDALLHVTSSGAPAVVSGYIASQGSTLG